MRFTPQPPPPEAFQADDCPRTLRLENGAFWLYLNHQPVERFATLKEYIDYWQRLKRRGTHCPVLYYHQQPNGTYQEWSFEQSLQQELTYEAKAAAFDALGVPPTTSTPTNQQRPPPPITQITAQGGKPQHGLGTVDSTAQYQGKRTYLTDRVDQSRNIDRDQPLLGVRGLSMDPLHPRFGGVDYRADRLRDAGYILQR